MLELLRHRTTAVWAGLVAATLLAWWLSADHAFGDSDAARSLTTVAVLLVAFVKVRFVLRDFMELRSAPAILRRIGDAWVIGMPVALVAMYLLR